MGSAVQNSLKSLLLALIAVTAFSQPASAEGSLYCHESRVVINSSAVDAKNKKFIKEFNSLSEKQFAVTKNLRKVRSIVLDKQDNSIRNRRPDFFVKFNANSDTCQIVKRKQRARRQAADSKIIRNIQCSCDYKVELMDTTPNDTHFGLMTSLGSSFGLNMPVAWDIFTGSSTVVAGIIDTGILYTHPDLSANIWSNPYETPSNGIDDDGNGYIDDIRGWDFYGNDNNPIDTQGHGTHVAGTVGAVGNNATGVVGVNWQVRLMALKIFPDGGGSTSLSYANEALNYVADMHDRGVNIVVTNNSYGGPTVASALSTMSGGISAQESRGILFVAAAGNSTINMDSGNPSDLIAPAAFSNNIIISVAASDTSGNLASFSNYGVNSVDIAAPGTSILSTYLSNNYAYLDGTSMAAPHVAGMVALVSGYNTGLSASEIKSKIIQTAANNSALSGLIANAKIANANSLLLNSAPGTPTVTPTSTMTFTASSTPTITPTRTATMTATNSSTPSITPTGAPTTVPTIAPTTAPSQVPTNIPTIAPTPTTQPALGQTYKISGTIINKAKQVVRRKKVPATYTSKLFILNEDDEIVEQINLRNSSKWSTRLPEGRYTISVTISNKSLKLSPPRLKLELERNTSALNFLVINK